MSKFKISDDQHHLVIDNLKLIGFYFKRHPLSSSMSRAEAKSEAMFWLCHAASRFKPELGFKFCTYAFRCICLGMMSWRDRVSKMKLNHQSVLQLDLPGGYADTALTLDMLADKHHDVHETLADRELVGKLLAQLHGPYRTVIEMRYGVGRVVGRHKLDEVADHLGISRERARQLEKKALARLSNIMQPSKLKNHHSKCASGARA